jgi:hypothetical protein
MRPPPVLRDARQPPQETTDMTHPDELTARVFRALYSQYDLLTIGVIHIVTPKGTPVFISDSLGQIARQLTSHQHPDPAAGHD